MIKKYIPTINISSLIKNNFETQSAFKTIKEIETIMERDSYFSPSEAIKFGLIDKVIENRK